MILPKTEIFNGVYNKICWLRVEREPFSAKCKAIKRYSYKWFQELENSIICSCHPETELLDIISDTWNNKLVR